MHPTIVLLVTLLTLSSFCLANNIDHHMDSEVQIQEMNLGENPEESEFVQELLSRPKTQEELDEIEAKKTEMILKNIRDASRKQMLRMVITDSLKFSQKKLKGLLAKFVKKQRMRRFRRRQI